MAKLVGRWVAKLIGRWMAKLVGTWVAKLIREIGGLVGSAPA